MNGRNENKAAMSAGDPMPGCEGKSVRLVVCGGRDFADGEKLEHALDELITELGDAELVTGHASGADSLAETYAEKHELPNRIIRPDWKRYGRAAGPMRNRRMLDYAAETNPYVLAFWDGASKGTKNTIDTARKMGIRVKIVRY